MIFRLISFFVCFVLFSFSVFAQDVESKIVREIQVISSNSEIDEQDILNELLIKKGDIYDSELVEKSIDWLWQYARIRVITVDVDPDFESETVVLYFNVEPLITFKNVVFVGNFEFDREELELWAGLVGQPIEEESIQTYIDRLLEGYSKEGYREAYIEYHSSDAQTLIFDILEGRQFTISRINFFGNTEFSESRLFGLDLQGTLQNTNGLFVDDPYVESNIEEDVLSLTRLYRDFGFLDATVTVESEINQQTASVVLNYHITQGDQYTIRSVQFKSADGAPLLFEESFLGENCLSQTGDPFRPNFAANDCLRIAKVYSAKGYPSASKVVGSSSGNRFLSVGGADSRGMPDVLFDIEKPVVDLVYTIQQGKPHRLRDVVLQGHLGTEDRVIRRQIELEPGDTVDEELAVLSWRRLMGLNYFMDAGNQPSVDWYWRSVEDNPELLDLVFDVQDKGSTNRFRFGGAWNSETGPALMISLTKSNVDITDLPSSFSNTFSDLFDNRAFHGSGQSLRMMASPGARYSTYSLSFTEPDLFEEHINRFGLQVSASKRIRFLRTHDESRGSLGFTLNRRFGRYFSLFGGPTIAKVTLSDLSAGAPISLSSYEGTNEANTFTLGARYNTVADPFSPVDGEDISLRISQTGSFMSGDWDFIKSTLRVRKHFPLWETEDSRRWILSTKLSVSKAWLTGDTTELPYSEGFFYGGERSMRGFDYRGIDLTNGYATSGRAGWNSSIELGFPLYGTRQRESVGMMENLRGAAFLDFGAVGDDFGELIPVRASTGLVFQLRLPAMAQLPLSFIFAKPIRIEDNDRTSTFSFTIGNF